MAQQFFIYKRNKIYYACFTSVYCGRLRMSTKCKTKAEAVLFCTRKIAELSALPEADIGDTFERLAKNWWIDGKCPYQLESKRNGRIISKGYLRTARHVLESRLLPVFGKMHIRSITPPMIDDWKYSMHEQDELSGKSVNGYLTILRTMMDYWWRRGILAENPCLKVRWMRKESAVRGILTDEEVRKLFSTKEAWSTPLAYLANVLAACSGMRMGEVQGLRVEDIQQDGTIIVRHSYDEKYGLKCTKTGIIRCIPLPAELHRALQDVAMRSDGYIFVLDGETHPMRRSCILRNLRFALKRIGISLEEQKQRNICFHSWRHYLNSRLRVSGVPDVVVKAVTGHTTDQMMEHYTHINAHDAEAVATVSDKVLPSGLMEPYEYVQARDAHGRFIG